MSIKYKYKLIVMGGIFSLYIAYGLASRAGYIQQLAPATAMAAALVLAFVGGLVVGATAVYIWAFKKEQRRAAPRPEEHAT